MHKVSNAIYRFEHKSKRHEAVFSAARTVLCWPINCYVKFLDARHKRRERKKLVPPVPVKRERRLTLLQDVDENDQSLFFRLPAEIRNMVYEEYFKKRLSLWN